MNRPFAGRSIVMELAARAPFRLGNATIDPVSREARWEGGEERLQPQTLKVLTALAAKRGDVVTRDELVDLCWDGRIIGDDVINRSISVLRQFAERAGGFAIQTVPKAGYRLIEHDQAVAGRRRWTAIAGMGLIVFATIMVGVGLSRRPASSASPTLTVSVVPFAAQGKDEGSRELAAQVEDSAIRMLTESGVSVSIAKSEEEQRRRQPDFVLSGSVAGSGAQAAATIQLEDPMRHAIVLAREIQAQAAEPDALPDQVGAQLSAALSWVAPLLRLDRAHPSDPAVIANLLNTNQTSFDSQEAYQRARRVAQGAPDSAIAQLALAGSTGSNIMVIPTAEQAGALAAGRDAAARAIRLAPDFGDVYFPWCMLHAEARIAECEANLRHGLAADPNAPSVLSILGILLRNVGRLDEALPIAAENLARNPYSPGKIAGMLIVFDATGRSDDAAALFRRGHRLWPQYDDLFLKRLGGMTARGNFEASAAFDREIWASGLFPGPHPSLARPLAIAIREHSLPLAQAACRHRADDDLPAIQCMLALARLGDLDEAFRLADRLYPRRTARTTAEEEAIWLANPDNLDTIYLTASGAAPLRRDPRYLALADRVGLLRYWREQHLPDFCTRSHEPVCRRSRRSGHKPRSVGVECMAFRNGSGIDSRLMATVDMVGSKRPGSAGLVRRSLFLLSLIALASPAFGEIGRVKTTLGTASIQRGADHIPAATGLELLPGDWLETGKDGRISLTFVDNTRWSVGPDSRIALTRFDYDPTTQHGSFVAQIERGSIAVVSGRITKSGRDGMQLLTPDGEINPRGTRFIVVVPR